MDKLLRRAKTPPSKEVATKLKECEKSGLEEARHLQKEATLLANSKKNSFKRRQADIDKSIQQFERAAALFEENGDQASAKSCWENAAERLAAQNNTLAAAKTMELAAMAAKKSSDWDGLEACSLRAADLYGEAGYPVEAAAAATAAAETLEPVCLRAASDLHSKAFDIISSNPDSPSSKIKSTHIDLGSAALKRTVTRSMCRAYLSSIVLLLYADDFKTARKEYKNALKTGGNDFKNSDEAKAAEELLQAFHRGDSAAISAVLQKWDLSFSRLEGGISILAKRLGSEGNSSQDSSSPVQPPSAE